MSAFFIGIAEVDWSIIVDGGVADGVGSIERELIQREIIYTHTLPHGFHHDSHAKQHDHLANAKDGNNNKGGIQIKMKLQLKAEKCKMP